MILRYLFGSLVLFVSGVLIFLLGIPAYLLVKPLAFINEKFFQIMCWTFGAHSFPIYLVVSSGIKPEELVCIRCMKKASKKDVKRIEEEVVSLKAVYKSIAEIQAQSGRATEVTTTNLGLN